MVFGMSLYAFTVLHVVISLLGITAGFFVFWSMVVGIRLPWQNASFLWWTTLTSLTGFGFPFVKFTPAYVFGVVSLLALGIATWALYSAKLQGRARGAFVISALLAQYLNVVVLVVQSFQKIPALHAIGPTDGSPAVGVSQTIVLAGFVFFGLKAFKNFK